MFAKHTTDGILPGWHVLLGRAMYARVSDGSGADPEPEQHPLTAPTSNGHRSWSPATVPPGQAGAHARPVELAVDLDVSSRHVTVRGELDLLTVPILASELATLIDLDPGDTTLDFAGVGFIDARGLGCLVGFADQLAARGARLTVAGVSTRLRRVFEIVQLGRLLQPL